MSESLYEAAEKKDWEEFLVLSGKVDKPDSFTDNKGNTALHMAVANGAPVEAVNNVLKHGADPNKKQFYGNTAVHIAAGSPNPRAADVLQLLVESGGDPNKRNNAECTPLHVAVNAKAPAPIFAVLVAKGADPLKKVKGKTVVEMATVAGLGPDVLAALANKTIA